MRQYFYDNVVEINQTITFKDDIAHHIKDVLRMQNDEIVRIVDKNRNAYLGKLIVNSNVSCLIIEEIENNANDAEIILAACLIKKEKWEYLIQKAAELGASKILPIISNRTIIHFDQKDIVKKTERFNKIALEACQQSNRTDVAEVLQPIKLKNIEQYKQEINLVAYEKQGNNYIRKFIDSSKSLLVLVGPEGGFDEKEIEFLNSIGFINVSLGNRILRAETACLYALSVIDEAKNEICDM